MKEFLLHNKAAVIVTVCLLLAAGAIGTVYLVTREDDPPKCTDFQSMTINAHSFAPDESVRIAHNADLGFKLDDWCTLLPPSNTTCRCKWTLQTLQFESAGSLPFGEVVTAEFHIPDAPSTIVRFFDFELAPVVDASDWALDIYEGTELVFRGFPANTLPLPYLEVAGGGLCVTVDIIGGDDEQVHRAGF